MLLEFRSLLESDNSVTGTIGVDYLYDDTTGVLLVDDVTAEPVTADGATLGRSVFAYSTAATAAETFTGTAAPAFGFSVALTGKETVTGTAAVAFPFTVAGTAAETITGTGAAAFTFAESVTARETFTGSGGEAFGFAAAASGTVASTEASGTGAVTFRFAVAGTAQNDSVVALEPAGGGPALRRGSPATPRPISGTADIGFTLRIAITAETNDDDLVLLLAA